jgi:hypothetical protein
MGLFTGYKIIAYQVGDSDKSWNHSMYYVKEEDIPNMIKAIIKLHHTPGINPYNSDKGLTARLQLLKIIEPPTEFAYWWTSPSLGLVGGDCVRLADVTPNKSSAKTIYASSAYRAKVALVQDEECLQYIEDEYKRYKRYAEDVESTDLNEEHIRYMEDKSKRYAENDEESTDLHPQKKIVSIKAYIDPEYRNLIEVDKEPTTIISVSQFFDEPFHIFNEYS